MFALLRGSLFKGVDMGYRYIHGGWQDRMYRATVIVNGRPSIITYSSCFGLNMYGNFVELREKIYRMFGIRIERSDVVERKLLAEWES